MWRILSLKSEEYFWNKGSNTPSYQNALSPCGSVMTIIIIIIIIVKGGWVIEK